MLHPTLVFSRDSAFFHQTVPWSENTCSLQLLKIQYLSTELHVLLFFIVTTILVPTAQNLSDFHLSLVLAALLPDSPWKWLLLVLSSPLAFFFVSEKL